MDPVAENSSEPSISGKRPRPPLDGLLPNESGLPAKRQRSNGSTPPHTKEESLLRDLAFTDLKQTAQQLKKNLEEYSERHGAAIKESATAIDENHKVLVAAKDDLQTEIKRLKTTLDGLRTKVEGCEANINGSHDQMTQKERSWADKFSELAKKTEATGKDYGLQSKRIDNLFEWADTFNKTYNSNVQSQAAVQEQQTKCSADIVKVADVQERLRTDISRVGEDVRKLQNDAQSRSEQIRALTASLGELERVSNDLADRSEALNTKMDELDDKMDRRQGDIQTILSTLATFGDRLEALEGDTQLALPQIQRVDHLVEDLREAQYKFVDHGTEWAMRVEEGEQSVGVLAEIAKANNDKIALLVRSNNKTVRFCEGEKSRLNRLENDWSQQLQGLQQDDAKLKDEIVASKERQQATFNDALRRLREDMQSETEARLKRQHNDHERQIKEIEASVSRQWAEMERQMRGFRLGVEARADASQCGSMGSCNHLASADSSVPIPAEPQHSNAGVVTHSLSSERDEAISNAPHGLQRDGSTATAPNCHQIDKPSTTASLVGAHREEPVHRASTAITTAPHGDDGSQFDSEIAHEAHSGVTDADIDMTLVPSTPSSTIDQPNIVSSTIPHHIRLSAYNALPVSFALGGAAGKAGEPLFWTTETLPQSLQEVEGMIADTLSLDRAAEYLERPTRTRCLRLWSKNQGQSYWPGRNWAACRVCTNTRRLCIVQANGVFAVLPLHESLRGGLNPHEPGYWVAPQAEMGKGLQWSTKLKK